MFWAVLGVEKAKTEIVFIGCYLLKIRALLIHLTRTSQEIATNTMSIAHTTMTCSELL